jgi:hypothetical protein
MTIQKMVDKYTNLEKKGFETITINQVIIDLRTIQLLHLRKYRKNKNGK